jgi:precorrin-3B C17-methyltransferase
VCGYVRNIGRENETTGILTLKELADFKADMFTTIYIGNSHTKVINGKMVTPRGYKVV